MFLKFSAQHGYHPASLQFSSLSVYILARATNRSPQVNHGPNGDGCNCCSARPPKVKTTAKTTAEPFTQIIPRPSSEGTANNPIPGEWDPRSTSCEHLTGKQIECSKRVSHWPETRQAICGTLRVGTSSITDQVGQRIFAYSFGFIFLKQHRNSGKIGGSAVLMNIDSHTYTRTPHSGTHSRKISV